MHSILSLKRSTDLVDDSWNLVEDNGGLDSALVFHRLQTLSPLLKLESLIDNTRDFYLARVEIVDCSS
jgi:hypothetical protein